MRLLRCRFAALILVALSVSVGAGCDDEDGESTQPASVESSESVEIADVGDAPTYPPAPVRGVELRAPEPTVIAAGLTSRGDPFELVLQGTSNGTCIVMTYPARESEGGGFCTQDPLLKFSGAVGAFGSSSSGREVSVDGFVSAEVDAVELSYERDGEEQTLEAVTEQISPRLLRQAGEQKPRGIFVAFLPYGVATEDVTATAFDAAGRPIGTASWPEILGYPGS